MYTWGYIKENTLNKLNMSEEEANQQDFLARFPYYANEAMTQICSAVKPRAKAFRFEITDEAELGIEKTFPDDFISFSDDVVRYKAPPLIINGRQVNESGYVEVGDDFVEYVGYNEIRCSALGAYAVPYNARWFFFTKETANSQTISAPADICDALPSYIASQCYKIDDEAKAAIYRNEFEMFLARMDDTSFKSQRRLHIGGDW